MTPSPARRYVRFAGLATAVAVLLAAVGWLPTRNLAGDAGTAAMLAACALALVASLVGGAPVLLADRDGSASVSAVLGSSLLRLTLLVGLAVAVVLAGALPRTPFLVWAAIAYLVLLVVDTLYASAAAGARVPILGNDVSETR